MKHAEIRIRDHSVIKTQEGRFTAAHALGDHKTSRAWLERELAAPFDGKTIVISHHAPHPLSVHPRYLAAHTLATNAAFASDLTPLLQRADIWCHGHVHNSFDYLVGRCRVVTNPLGYANNRHEADAVANLEFENAHFNWACVIEVEA